ncbi:RHS repeat-associated core domain-containing protein [Methylomonas koyamae]|uniref:RHS repeat-associated core domain-containing protein n=1 Tax=Methylomonas koyamae TaxID=702114 RepID=UPI000AA31AC0|nr:RHS repeat-associated core domain-containing protein [Methylomonas koyamae]
MALLSVTAEDGKKIDYTRNPLGQPTRAETWSPAPNSQLEAAYDYVYDAAHRLQQVSDNRGYKTLSYAWSPGGQLDSLTDNDGRGTYYLYDEVGRLISLWAPNFDHYTFDYDNGGRLIEARYPNGIDQTLAWNADNSLNKIAHKNNATVIAQSQYGYDGLGRRKTNQETLSGQTTLSYTYGYDPLDRLINVNNGTAAQTQAFGYDVYGNRVQKQIGNPITATTAYKHNAANQLTEVHQTDLNGALLEAYLYDEAGNQSKKCSGGTVTRASDTACTGGTQNQYGYDSFQRLSQFVSNGVTTGQYRYDDQGRRIQKTEGATTTNYLYDGQSLYAEYPGSGWTTANAVYVQAGQDHPLARLTGNINLPSATAAYYHQDGLGSVLATTNAAKTITATQRFDAYGSKIGGTGTVPQYGYTGREPDASGLIYYRARYYDPNQIRFTQRDPLGYTDGLNRYSYVHNNPINFNDPNGLLANKVSNAWTAGQSYYNTASNIAGQIGWGGAGQFGLDILASSEVPVVSQVAGLSAAGIYAYQGDAFGTSTSLAGMFPVAGIIGDAARIGRWADKGVDLAKQADNIPGPVQNVISTADRANELRNSIPAAQQGRITMGVGTAEDANGVKQVLVGTSEPRGYLRPGVTLNSGETLVSGTGHAEADIINYANQNGLNLLEVGATRPICPACAELIKNSGAQAVTPLK